MSCLHMHHYQDIFVQEQLFHSLTLLHVQSSVVKSNAGCQSLLQLSTGRQHGSLRQALLLGSTRDVSALLLGTLVD